MERHDGLLERYRAVKMNLHILEEDFKEKIKVQNQIPTYADKILIRTINKLKNTETLQEFINEGQSSALNLNLVYSVLMKTKSERYQPHAKRILEESHNKGLNSPPDEKSQGLSACLKWRGLTLVKTKEDFAVIPQLIQELKPQTIIEIGSGNGSSAVWMADHLQLNEISGKVISIDPQKVGVSHKAVEFIPGSAVRISELLPKSTVESLPHPWLVVDDAHETIESVFNYLNPFFTIGDYIYVEDSQNQQQTIARLIMQDQNSFFVDTFYTDFFGRNSVSAFNSVLKKLK